MSWGSPDPDAGQSEKVGIEHRLVKFPLDNAKIHGKYGKSEQGDLECESGYAHLNLPDDGMLLQQSLNEFLEFYLISWFITYVIVNYLPITSNKDGCGEH